MEKLRWIATLAEMPFLGALVVGTVVPLALIPAPVGEAVAGAAVVGILAFNFWLEHSVSRLPVRLGPDSLRGRDAHVMEPLMPSGTVRCDGEVWKAREVDGRRVSAGEQVRVVGVRGIELQVVATPVSGR